MLNAKDLQKKKELVLKPPGQSYISYIQRSTRYSSLASVTSFVNLSTLE